MQAARSLPVMPFGSWSKCAARGKGSGLCGGIREFWDAETVASARRGQRDNGGVDYGRVTLKAGAKRNFTNRDLMQGAVGPRHTPFGHSQIRRGAVLSITERRACAETRDSRQRSRAMGRDTRFMRSWPVELLSLWQACNSWGHGCSL